jgi:hypothetical protein
MRVPPGEMPQPAHKPSHFMIVLMVVLMSVLMVVMMVSAAPGGRIHPSRMACKPTCSTSTTTIKAHLQ